MHSEDRYILERDGWTIECESPFEIRHQDGSFAKGQGADYVLAGLREDYRDQIAEFNTLLSDLLNFLEVNPQCWHDLKVPLLALKDTITEKFPVL